VEDELQLDNNTEDPCSKQKIIIPMETDTILTTNMGAVDDEYDPGF
jgi:hypothetical protein